MINSELSTNERLLLLHLISGELDSEEEQRLNNLGGQIVRLSSKVSIYKAFCRRPRFNGWPTYLSGSHLTLERDLAISGTLVNPISVSFDEAAGQIGASCGYKEYMETFSALQRGQEANPQALSGANEAIAGLACYIKDLRQAG